VGRIGVKPKDKPTRAVAYPDSASNAVTVTLNGRLVSSTTAHGQQPTAYSYDALGRLTGIADPRTGTALTHYDSRGWVDYIEDAAGNRTTYAYDAATGQRIGQTDALSNTVRYAYLLAGRRKKILARLAPAGRLHIDLQSFRVVQP